MMMIKKHDVAFTQKTFAFARKTFVMETICEDTGRKYTKLGTIFQSECKVSQGNAIGLQGNVNVLCTQ